MAVSACGELGKLPASWYLATTACQVRQSHQPQSALLIAQVIAVWGCDWHWTGQFLASGAMDHCCKLWNPEGYVFTTNLKRFLAYSPTIYIADFSGVCAVTLRGHADSVNRVKFIPYSDSLASCSADKTVSLWDIRTVSFSHHLFLPLRLQDDIGIIPSGPVHTHLLRSSKLHQCCSF